MASKSFGPTKNLAGKQYRDGALGDAISDIRADVETAFAAMEGGNATPLLHKSAGTLSAAAPGTTSSVVLTGSNFLLNGQIVKAAVTVEDADSEGKLKLTAQKGGESGNDITIEIEGGAGINVAVTGSAIKVTLENGVSDTTAIASAINSDSDAGALVFAEVAAGGATTWAADDAVSATNLKDGDGDDISIVIGDPAGTACKVKPGSATWTDSSISLADAAVSIAVVAGDEVSVWAKYGDSLFRLGTLIGE